MRSGLQRIPPETATFDTQSSSEDNDSATGKSVPRPHARRGRGGGRVGKRPSRTKRPRLVGPVDQADTSDRPTTATAPENPRDRTEDPNTLPDLTNYHQIGMKWGQARAEQVLSSIDLPKNNRISALGLFEAQALQTAYNLDKTMLCIVLKCSRQVLDEALLEGPLAREPNMYTNFQTYSVAATSTHMPPRGVSEGFKERNVRVGSTWSAFEPEEQEIFTPRVFERLCVATSEAYALTHTPLGAPGMHPRLPTQSQLPPLTDEELARYVPIFHRLVNLRKVSGDLHEGRLWRHSTKNRANTREQLIKLEINKIVRQLHVLNNHFGLQFHLMVASWNPASTSSRALFQNEHTSCARWAKLQKKTHLLERFTFEATQVPEHLRKKPEEAKPLSAAAARQTARRSKLARALNELISPFLCGGYQGKGDSHPKVPNLKAAFEKKEYRGKVLLTFQLSPDSGVTENMLAKGPGHLTNHEVETWLADIQAQRYKIVKVTKEGSPFAHSNSAQLTTEVKDETSTLPPANSEVGDASSPIP
ncbi:hypothetical protein DFH28DRAFT_880442 [Melampsora americana]|nr:hypothetical protein DFH28DRAFT_880442 [Melampsora americana]